MPERASKEFQGIPGYELESLTRVLLPAIQAFFQTEEGRKEFEDWKKQRENQSA